MNNFGLIPVGLWIELINSCKRFGYQISFIDDFDKKIRNPNISYETFNEYIKRLFHNSKITPRDYQIDGVYKMNSNLKEQFEDLIEEMEDSQEYYIGWKEVKNDN